MWNNNNNNNNSFNWGQEPQQNNNNNFSWNFSNESNNSTWKPSWSSEEKEVYGTKDNNFTPYTETMINGKKNYYQHICVHKKYENKSQDELRFEDNENQQNNGWNLWNQPQQEKPKQPENNNWNMLNQSQQQNQKIELNFNLNQSCCNCNSCKCNCHHFENRNYNNYNRIDPLKNPYGIDTSEVEEELRDPNSELNLFFKGNRNTKWEFMRRKEKKDDVNKYIKESQERMRKYNLKYNRRNLIITL